MTSLLAVVDKYRVRFCLDCGKCASVCPVTRWEATGHASPRLLVERASHGQWEALLDDPLLWACLTCKRCTSLCPSGVVFSEFVREARAVAWEGADRVACAHSGTLQALGRMMADPGLRQDRLGWLGDGLETSADSDTLFFAGCLPYFDPVFEHLGFEGVEISRAAVRILNALGVQPQVLAGERCCGHDQLWGGDMHTFRALGTLNLEALRSSGARRVVTTCPECARTLKYDYPEHIGEHGLEVVHLSEFLAESGLSLRSAPPPGVQVTYQDPCRLGRHLGVYEAPRELLAGMGYEVVEMPRNRAASQCCGTSGWSHCGRTSMAIQAERLEEARGTGAALLVTACQKCQIHLKCAQQGRGEGDRQAIEVRDLTTLIAEALSTPRERDDTQEVYHES